MIDPILSLAFSMHSGKGLYALLLGSGVSRAAKIPTGWEVTLDLIRKLAILENADPEPDPGAWYAAKHGRDPNYSELLNELAKTAAERSHLLRSYFEPNPQERERGEKSPTAAHAAIADLVASGYVRVIITTNFDRLMEQALQAAGVQPTVVSSAAQAEGMPALSQVRCLVLKVHGDYLEATVKNTPDELDAYDASMDAILDRIFDEFGLVVSGWSAEYDLALVRAVERCRNRRYTAYWTLIGHPNEIARSVIKFRNAVAVETESADVFFKSLVESVRALEKFGSTHPLSTAVAVARLKAYLGEPAKNRIALHDLVTEVVDELYRHIVEYRQPSDVHSGGAPLLEELVKLEKRSEMPLHLIVNGMWWGSKAEADLWRRAFSRLASPQGALPGDLRPVNLKIFPALLATYTAGISCCAAGNYILLHEILNRAVLTNNRERNPLVSGIYTGLVIDNRIGQSLPGHENQYTAVNNRLHSILRTLFRSFLPDDAEYNAAFDRYEYLLGLSHANWRANEERDPWGPLGRFAWRHSSPSIMSVIRAEAEAQQDSWPPLGAGMFNGSLQRFLELQQVFTQHLIPRSGWY